MYVGLCQVIAAKTKMRTEKKTFYFNAVQEQE